MFYERDIAEKKEWIAELEQKVDEQQKSMELLRVALDSRTSRAFKSSSYSSPIDSRDFNDKWLVHRSRIGVVFEL